MELQYRAHNTLHHNLICVHILTISLIATKVFVCVFVHGTGMWNVRTRSKHAQNGSQEFYKNQQIHVETIAVEF